MAYALTASPAYTVRPGTVTLKDGAVFSCVFHDCSCFGLILYHLPDLEEVLRMITATEACTPSESKD